MDIPSDAPTTVQAYAAAVCKPRGHDHDAGQGLTNCMMESLQRLAGDPNASLGFLTLTSWG